MVAVEIGNGFVAAAGETVTASEDGVGSLQGTGTCEVVNGVTDGWNRRMLMFL
jgi:hypothetical protein